MNAPHTPSLAAPSLAALAWSHGFGQLPESFHTRLAPSALPDPYLVAGSAVAALAIGLDPAALSAPDTVAALAGSRVPQGAAPLAAVYAGHQFGVYVPQLGDGRALLLGDVPSLDGGRWELQLKGSGRTPYSRMGDGRAVLRSSIREFLASEAMAGLGIPTTRALAVVGADQPVIRESVETAAVVLRMSPSFVRFGNFELFFWRQQGEPLRILADYVIDTFYPACRDAPQPYLALLEQVVARTAEVIAQWQAVGFCHGVMNTDNMSILGLTIDYGPFQFMDGFDAAHICNHSDDTGRYAYNQQPAVAHWNLYCLGQALIPLIEDVEAIQAVLERFKPAVTAAMEQRFRDKLGLATSQEGDDALLQSLLERLQAERTDWTLFWRQLALIRGAGPSPEEARLRDLFVDRAAFDAWAAAYRARLQREASDDDARARRMRAVNPRYVLRNHLAEVAIRKARGDEGPRDFDEVRRLLQVLRHPYDEQPEYASYAQLPPQWAGNLHLSCSS